MTGRQRGVQDVVVATLDEEDFISAYRPAGRTPRMRNLALSLALLIVLLIVLLVVRYPEARSAFTRSPLIVALAGAVVLAAGLVLALLTAAPALRRRAAKVTLNDHPGMRDPVHYTFDAETFSVRTTYTEARYPWSQLWDWRECERTVIILPTPRNFYVLPKRACDDATLTRLRGYLRAARRRQAKRRTWLG
jgi:hypothetical protein